MFFVHERCLRNLLLRQSSTRQRKDHRFVSVSASVSSNSTISTNSL